MVKFRQAYANSQFDVVYDNGAAELKKAQSKEEFVSLLGAIRRKLGDVTTTKRVNWNVNYSGGATTVILF